MVSEHARALAMDLRRVCSANSGRQASFSKVVHMSRMAWFLLGAIFGYLLFAGNFYYEDQKQVERILKPPKRVWQI
jgi:hypothetical protein